MLSKGYVMDPFLTPLFFSIGVLLFWLTAQARHQITLKMDPGKLSWLLEGFILIFDPKCCVRFAQKNFLHRLSAILAPEGGFMEIFFDFEVQTRRKRSILSHFVMKMGYFWWFQSRSPAL